MDFVYAILFIQKDFDLNNTTTELMIVEALGFWVLVPSFFQFWISGLV